MNEDLLFEQTDYEQTRQRLMEDPIVMAMAISLKVQDPPKNWIFHEDGKTPRFEFMMQANKEYRRRGGEDGGHLGAIAEAIIRLLEKLEDK